VTSAKRILISGYYGFSNVGDEAVLSAIIEGLRAQVGDGIEITVLSSRPEETANLHRVRAVPRAGVSVIRALQDTDLVISGGGSLIQDATSFRSLAYYLWVIALAKFYRRKVMILGQGIGPLRRSASRRLAGAILNRIDLITVRDAGSAELLRELGVSRPPVQVTADPTFLLRPCPEEEAISLLAEAGLGPEDGVIAFSLRPWREAPGMEDAAIEALRQLKDVLPAKALLVAMQSPEDETLVRKVGVMAGVLVQPRAWTAEQLLGVLARCRLVVAMRLHALIFASAVGVPSLGIIYDPKVEQFVAATGQEGITLEEVASGGLAERVTAAWNVRDELASRLAERVPAMRESAAENFRLAGELLV
jgi:polysaccharide pyruvyl transferase CsaB